MIEPYPYTGMSWERPQMTSAYTESLALTQHSVKSIGPTKEVATMDRRIISGEMHRNRMTKYGRRSREYGIEIVPSLSSSLQFLDGGVSCELQNP